MISSELLVVSATLGIRPSLALFACRLSVLLVWRVAAGASSGIFWLPMSSGLCARLCFVSLSLVVLGDSLGLSSCSLLIWLPGILVRLCLLVSKTPYMRFLFRRMRPSARCPRYRTIAVWQIACNILGVQLSGSFSSAVLQLVSLTGTFPPAHLDGRPVGVPLPRLHHSY
ncbi:hypothetical protein PLICRDRAFT_663134 [Plicaturopsis crispa FD-325 SS-3]|nr:hypothetical protein PLICRDRAFT_663134 [Plicaturopsis crispa FD-325 SS-3]